MKDRTAKQIIADLPEYCYGVKLSTGEVIKIKAGESGYYKTDVEPSINPRLSIKIAEASQIADEKNASIGVTKAQRMAMQFGSQFGWEVPAADPRNYTTEGEWIKSKPETV